jgi:hypothetical protein
MKISIITAVSFSALALAAPIEQADQNTPLIPVNIHATSDTAAPAAIAGEQTCTDSLIEIGQELLLIECSAVARTWTHP